MLSITYTGNQLKSVSDTYPNKGFIRPTAAPANEMDEYAYNSNGAMRYDYNRGIMGISYNNSLNLPRRIQFKYGYSTDYAYDALGVKRQVKHRGNNQGVITPGHGAYNLKWQEVQETNFYPSGMPFSNYNTSYNYDYSGGMIQPYTFEGKEYDKMHGLNKYDQGARLFGSDLPITMTQDPLAEKYYDISPYVSPR